MKVIKHTDMDVVEWRQGVETRMLVSALTGSMQLCIFEQICDPGLGAPTHLHAVEEVLTVVEGRAEIWVGNDRTIAGAGTRCLSRPAPSTASETSSKPSCTCARLSRPRSSRRATRTGPSCLAAMCL